MKKLLTILGSTFRTSSITASNFEVGQVWKYQTREHETNSTLTIVQVDTLNNEEIIHISIEGVSIKNPQSPSGYGESVSHLPISTEALKSSVTKLVQQVSELPDYTEGYQTWREAYDSGNGGFFTISVAKCVEYMETAVNQ